MAAFTDIVVTTPKTHVTLIQLNRPQVYNALRFNLLQELSQALAAATTDDAVRCVVITGNDKAFAAGADINEFQAQTLVSTATDRDQRSQHWQALRGFPKPVIAAVNGFALGGGCEMAMNCDIIIAGDTAKFGQPEINLGIIPGGGGTQRLPRTVGKSLAMKMILSGERIDAETALTAGLVAEVVPAAKTLERALELAELIASKPPIAVRMAKDAVLRSYDVPIEAGLLYERRAFSILFATEDRKEGVAAFLEKRKATFKGQ
ncbi:MAG: 2,3-dehydroadipyl-CoA hydratase [Alphaproteobacteria bacterium]|nr:2,3-dehydroadipyl-CoA hydratase [Alphaproteobacteria bacterium]